MKVSLPTGPSMESQPKQRLADSTIKQFIAHDDDRTSI